VIHEAYRSPRDNVAQMLKLFAGLVIIPGLALGLIGCSTSTAERSPATRHTPTTLLWN